MADDKPNAPESKAGPNRGRRRPAPTLDLTATEIPTPEASEAAAGSAPEAAQPKAATGSESTDAPTTAASTSDAVPPAQQDATDTAAPAPESEPVTSAAEPPQAPPPVEEAPPPEPEPEAQATRRSTPILPMLGAAVGGGAIVVIAAIALLVWWGIPQRNGDAGPQAEQLAALEARVRDLAGRIPASETNRVAALSERVGKLESATSAATPATDPAIAEKITAAEQQVAALTRELAEVKQRADSNAAAVEAAQSAAAAAAAKAETAQASEAQGAAVDRRAMDELGARLAKLEETAQALRSEVARQKSALDQQQAAIAKEREQRVDQRAVRLAIAAELLKAAVARGDRYRGELDAAKTLAANPEELAPLEQFADSGVPSVAALGQQLRAALPAMRKAAAPKAATTGSFLERLQVNAERLVRIQPVEEQGGDDAGATLSRVDAKAARGDIAGALTELKSLPANVRAPAENWIKTAEARQAAIEASSRFAAAHVGALAGKAR